MTNLFARAKVPLICVSLTLLATLLISLVSLFSVRLLCALLLLYFLPGFLAIRAFFPGLRLLFIEKLLLAVGFSYMISVLSTYALVYLQGKLVLTPLLVFYMLLVVALAVVSTWRANHAHTAEEGQSESPPYILTVLAIGTIGACFRFIGLGYADFLWDEAFVVWRIVGVINGEPGILFRHSNPVGQVLASGAFCFLTGRLDEFAARFPFALAGTLAVVTIYFAAREVFGDATALAAAALVATNGFFVGFSRTSNYPSFVLFMATLSIWAAYRFYKSGYGPWLAVAGIFAATGLLGHYEAGFVLPGLLYLVWKRWASVRAERTAYYRAIVAGMLIFILLVASFFLPYALDANASRAIGQIGKVLGEAPPYNNLDQLFHLSLFFSPAYYCILVSMLLAIALIAPLRSLSLRASIYGLAAGGAAAILLGLFLRIGVLDWSLPLSLTLLVWLIASPSAPPSYKAALIWFATTFFVYTYFISVATTHYYLVYLSGSLLAGWGFSELLAALRRLSWGQLKRRVAIGTTLLALSALYFLSCYGLYLLFNRYDLEYLMTYPRHATRLFPVDTEQRALRQAGTWGFPFRQGWQMVSYLYRAGDLQGDWGSNDRGRSVEWYTLGIPRNDNCYPRYYFLVEDPLFNPVKVPEAVIERDYTLMGRVWANDELRMRIYTLAPDREEAPEVQDFHEPARYDTYTTWEMLNPPLESPGNADVNLANKVRFTGYQVDNRETRPGGTLVVTIFWQAIQPMTERYKVFLHVEDERIWGQHDSEPHCGLWPTDGWTVGQVVLDRHLVPLDPQTPEGEHPLVVGLYDTFTGERLTMLNDQGAPQGDHISLGVVIVRTPAGGTASLQGTDG
jgi:4-amino-4-deoxy-L-arabinose transferase-like glycosyltransferase